MSWFRTLDLESPLQFLLLEFPYFVAGKSPPQCTELVVHIPGQGDASLSEGHCYSERSGALQWRILMNYLVQILKMTTTFNRSRWGAFSVYLSSNCVAITALVAILRGQHHVAWSIAASKSFIARRPCQLRTQEMLYKRPFQRNLWKRKRRRSGEMLLSRTKAQTLVLSRTNIQMRAPEIHHLSKHWVLPCC